MMHPEEKERLRALVLLAFGIASVVGTVTLLVTTWWPWAWFFAAACVGIASWMFSDTPPKK